VERGNLLLLVTAHAQKPQIDLGMKMKMINKYESGQSFMLDGVS
jgi:hypothetical protein